MSYRDEPARASTMANSDRPTSHKITATRNADRRFSITEDRVVDETPVALIYNGEPHVVMLATPADLRDFAIGFSLTEGIIKHPDEINYLDITPCESGVQVHIRTELDQDQEGQREKRKRNLTGRTGCGLCGTALIQEAVRNTPVVQSDTSVTTDIIYEALSNLGQFQPVNNITGAIHAAAWINDRGEIKLVREDVGRHNALDKLIGALSVEDGFNPSTGFVIITSRASYEMVTKSAFAGIAILVAISAPTSLAITIAEKSNITLVGFARDQSCVIYTHPSRVTGLTE